MSRRPVASTPIYLNVYDLSPYNDYMYNLGLGVYHSGIEINGQEYSFGGGAGGGDGVFTCTPREVGSNAVFREQIWLGEVRMSASDIEYEISKLRPEFRAADYHVIKKNCNVFSNSLAMALLNKGIPGYVNRMAMIGTLCNCFQPEPPTDTPTYSSSQRNRAPAFHAFKGQGQSLLSPSTSSSSSSSSSTTTSAAADIVSDPTAAAAAKREKQRIAAMARLGKT